jgi:hypothetical protein
MFGMRMGMWEATATEEEMVIVLIAVRKSSRNIHRGRGRRMGVHIDILVLTTSLLFSKR